MHTGTGVIQPIGNQDTWSFLATTAWPNPTRLAASSQVPGVSPDTCAPVRPNFYQTLPQQFPEGPIDPYFDPFPNGSKSYPGAPIAHNGNGGFISPQPYLPPIEAGRAPAAMTSEQLSEELSAQEIRDEFLRSGIGALGTVVALGLVAYIWSRRR